MTVFRGTRPSYFYTYHAYIYDDGVHNTRDRYLWPRMFEQTALYKCTLIAQCLSVEKKKQQHIIRSFLVRARIYEYNILYVFYMKMINCKPPLCRYAYKFRICYACELIFPNTNSFACVYNVSA